MHAPSWEMECGGVVWGLELGKAGKWESCCEGGVVPEVSRVRKVAVVRLGVAECLTLT